MQGLWIEASRNLAEMARIMGKSGLAKMALTNADETRGAMEQTDWHDQSERAFLVHLAQQLDSAVAAGKAKSLIVVAPPRALGMIRPAYSQTLKGAVRAEVDKDFVKMPVHEIERHLTAV